MGFIHWCIDQSYWQYGTLGLVYGPATLVIHLSDTGVWASYTGNFVVTAPVYEPASLVVHHPYTGVWANYTGNSVVQSPVYGPTILAIHHPYTGVSPNYTGGFVILGLVVVHRCITQLCWHFFC